MALLKDITLPDALKEELANLVRKLPTEAFVTLASLDKDFAQGFRAVPQNVQKFRNRMMALVESPDPVPPSVLESLRQNSFQQQFTCVLSSLALTEGYKSLATFIGEARLLLSMLLDRRGSVVKKAREIVLCGAPIAPPPASPEVARKAMVEMFDPFLKELTVILFPPVRPTEQAIVEELALIKKQTHELEKDKRTAATHAASLERKHEKVQSQLEISEKAFAEAKTQLVSAGKQLATDQIKWKQLLGDNQTLRLENQKLRQTLEDERSCRTSESDSLGALRANFSTIAAENAALRIELEGIKCAMEARQQEKRINTKAEFKKTLEETLPPKPLPRTARERLSEMTASPLKMDEKIIILLDGHNILNLIQPYASAREAGATHEELRKALLRDVARIQNKLGCCEMRLYFDGPTATETTAFGNKDLKIIYSGGTGDHRADRRIADYLEFTRLQPNKATLITVTEDQDLRQEVRTSGSLLLYPGEFITL